MQAQHLMYSAYGELSKINADYPEKDGKISQYLVARNQKIHLDLYSDFATRGTGVNQLVFPHRLSLCAQ